MLPGELMKGKQIKKEKIEKKNHKHTNEHKPIPKPKQD